LETSLGAKLVEEVVDDSITAILEADQETAHGVLNYISSKL